MKRTIEIDDTLQETKDQCVSEFMELFWEHFEEHPDTDADGFFEAISYNGRDHEIIDSNTPIYYSEINALYYLYGDELDEAYKNAGIYGPGEAPDNRKQVAIYCWLEENATQEVREKVEELIDSLADFQEYYSNRSSLGGSIALIMAQKITEAV